MFSRYYQILRFTLIVGDFREFHDKEDENCKPKLRLFTERAGGQPLISGPVRALSVLATLLSD